MAFFKKKVMEQAETNVINTNAPEVKPQEQQQPEQSKEVIELSADEILLLNVHREKRALEYKQIHLLQEIKDLLEEILKKA